jgi:hypothetical protein
MKRTYSNAVLDYHAVLLDYHVLVTKYNFVYLLFCLLHSYVTAPLLAQNAAKPPLNILWGVLGQNPKLMKIFIGGNMTQNLLSWDD